MVVLRSQRGLGPAASPGPVPAPAREQPNPTIAAAETEGANARRAAGGGRYEWLEGVTAELGVLYALIASYALFFMMQAPVLPALTSRFGGADGAAYGNLQSAFSVVQMVGGLLAGPVLDAYGAKAALLISLGASAACYGLAGSATSMAYLYVSKLPGLLQHAVLAGRAMAAARSPPHLRAKLIGFVGAAYGLGFAVGPALGGFLAGGKDASTEALQLVAWVAAAGSAASVIVAVVFLRAPKGDSVASAPVSVLAVGVATGAGAGALLVAQKFGRVVAARGVPALLAVKLLSGFAAAVFHTALPLAASGRFAMGPREMGLLMSYAGGLALLSQALVLDAVTHRLSESRAVGFALAALAASFAGLAAAGTVAHLLVLMIPMVVAGTVLASVNTAQLTKAVSPADHGTVLSLDMSLGSAVRVGAPLAASALMRRGGFGAVCIAAAVVAVSPLGLMAVGLGPTGGDAARRASGEGKTRM